MGHLSHPDETDRSIVLIGADDGFWPVFKRSAEYADRRKDPIDRWSKRILGAIADAEGGTCVFPSDGPPFAPFIAWAQGTGRFWPSPTGMLVHDRAGLMISIRGALILKNFLPAHTPSGSPCLACVSRPCATACPIGALSDQHFYDVPACKTYIASARGSDCMTKGCATRLACPVSQEFARPTEQTAFHMRAFRGN